ncbi:Phosphatidylinositol 4-kinase alpha 1 [Vitis vinifera]|uniref:Phosphatidylinositol 4-kinase alpha 1 n=1 Tax=Vitis vinifera TaxID=29760 RepID=A0A438C0Z5_VITVI|nr:Phosphatidylinositol 4-kinase alpha 1 [Vitis vinifera]
MEALTELCDLIAENPEQFSEKLAWICSRCPPPESLLGGSPRVSRSHLNAVLAIARFLARCPNQTDHHQRPQSMVLEFLRSVPSSFNQSFWPQSYGQDAISAFYVDFLGYVAKATELSPDFATEVAGFAGEVLITALNHDGEGSGISRVFLMALSQNFPPILPSDAERLVTSLLDQFVVSVPVSAPMSPREAGAAASETSTSSAQSSPISVNHYQPNDSSMSPANEVSRLSGSSSAASASSKGGGAAMLRQQVSSFEEESVESLEKQEIAFELIGHILDKVHIDPKLVEQVRLIAKKQLQSLSAFLKLRKRDWTEQGPLLKTRINTKLSVFQAAARLKIKSLSSLDSEGKSSKRLLLETLALLVDASEACLLSVWRKLRICEELFSSLLAGILQIALTRGGQLLRVLLIRLKSLVLTACAQADTWGNSQGAMFEIVMKTSCEIIEFGWIKDRAPVDTFILGLASSIRERNDYEEQEAWVEDVWSHSRGGVWAPPRFSRWLDDWEVFDVERFLLRLQGMRVYSDVEDQVVWTKAKDGRFFVKSLYKALEPERLGDFPARVIWNSLMPSRVSFFCLGGYVEKGLNLG